MNICHQTEILLYGENSQFQKTLQWQWQNMHGRTSKITQRFLIAHLRELRQNPVSTPPKNPLLCTNGFCPDMQNPETRFSTLMAAPDQFA